MFPDSVIDVGLIQAFRETHYQVHGAVPFTLRVDESSTALAAAHKRFRADCSAYITACNPFSEDVGAASNAQRHADLGLELARRSLASSAERLAEAQARRQRAAEQIILDDPFVQRMMRDFGARIVPGSIKPVERH